jgi:hypothetical protein
MPQAVGGAKQRRGAAVRYAGSAACVTGLLVSPRQTGSKFVQFSIADRSVSYQRQHGADLKRLTLPGDYPT